MTIANTVSNTTFKQLRSKVNEVIGYVNTLGTGNVSNSYLQATFATKAYAASNIAVRLLINDRLQVANAVATFQTKAIERAALANTNSYIATRATWGALTSTNTALRTLISDRLQVANADNKYATKAYAASNSYVKIILANTNAYIATRASWAALTSTNTAIRNYVDSKVAAANTSQLVNGSYNLTLQANSALRLPSGAKLISGFPGFGQYLSNFGTLAGDYVYLSSANGYSYIGVENQVPVIGNGPNMWAFDPDGTIRFPDNTIQATAYAGSSAYLQVTNANATFATKAYAASNAAVRTLISDRLQVANAAATYQTKSVERAALANTNAYIATRASWSGLTSTNTALRTLISDRYQVANVNTLLTAKATWAGLTATNTALRILINDRIQVANVAAKYATKAYAASNAYVNLILANTNSYIADVESQIAAANEIAQDIVDYGFITSSVDIDTSRNYGTII